MPKFKDLNSLFAYVNNSIKKAFKHNVSPVVDQTMQEQIKQKVYDSYSPRFYERRYELGSADNISSEIIEDGVLFTKNTAGPNESVFHMTYVPETSTIFPGWVNDGQVPNIFNNRTDYPWMYPRDFIASSVEELESTGKARDALAKGLESSGITVTTSVKRGG